MRKRIQACLISIGSSKVGKSTILGHLLYKGGAVDKRSLSMLERGTRELGDSSYAFAWILTKQKEERELFKSMKMTSQ